MNNYIDSEWSVTLISHIGNALKLDLYDKNNLQIK